MIKKIFYVLLSTVLLVQLYGCALLVAGAVGGAGTAFWLSGKLSDEINAPYEKTLTAARSALKSLDMKIDKESKSDEVTQLRSNYSDDREVWIDIRPLTPKTSKVEIRVGMKGDQSASTKILEHIKKSL